MFHEVAHGWVAYRLGDSTAARLGRLTLNPFAHVDLFGTILLPLMLIVTHAPFVFGYAKPVPVNFLNLRNPKRDMIWVAAAGPAMNLALAFVCTVIWKSLAPMLDARPDPAAGSAAGNYVTAIGGVQYVAVTAAGWRAGFGRLAAALASGEIGAHRAFRLHHSDRIADDAYFGLHHRSTDGVLVEALFACVLASGKLWKPSSAVCDPRDGFTWAIYTAR